MPARYVRPYSRGQKNDFPDAINMMTAKALGINITATPLGARLPIL
jgi:hypothetical protein